MNIEPSEYIDARGHNHYRAWVSALDPSIRARIDKSVLRMTYGNLAGAKPEGEGVSALRLDFGPGYRIYFGQDGKKLLILLAGGNKTAPRERHPAGAVSVGRVQEAQARKAERRYR